MPEITQWVMDLTWVIWIMSFLVLILGIFVWYLLDEYAKKQYVKTLDDHDAKVVSDYRAVTFKRCTHEQSR